MEGKQHFATKREKKRKKNALKFWGANLKESGERQGGHVRGIENIRRMEEDADEPERASSARPKTQDEKETSKGQGENDEEVTTGDDWELEMRRRNRNPADDVLTEGEEEENVPARGEQEKGAADEVVGEQEALQFRAQQDEERQRTANEGGAQQTLAKVNEILASGKINLATVFAHQREERGLRYRREETDPQVYSSPPPEITTFVNKWITIRENAITNEKKRIWMIEPWFELCKGFRALVRRLENTDSSESELSGYEYNTKRKGKNETIHTREQNAGTISYPQAKRSKRGKMLEALDPQQEMAIHYEGKMPHHRLGKRRSFQHKRARKA